MVKEDYVSFETAKLLKEKGFESDECIAIYDLGDNNTFVRDSGIFDNGPEDYLEFQWGEEWRRFGYYLAPTLQMAMKWLREKGWFIHIDIIREASCWTVDIQDIKNNVGLYIPKGYGFSSYEEACEAAIKYCLENLI